MGSAEADRNKIGAKMNYQINPKLRTEMIAWLQECSWRNMEAEDFNELSDADLVHGIINHYSGGLQQFIKDGK